jgi:DNA-binding CsgD family transcriptional regulator
LLEAVRGSPAAAAHWAGDAGTVGELVAGRGDWLELLRARGLSALCAGDPERAVEDLEAIWSHVERERVDVGVFPVAPDLVEGLLQLGKTCDALSVVERLAELAEEQDHPWGRRTASACRALATIDAGTYAAAASTLAETAAWYQEVGLRFDQARTLLARGRAERRLRKWGAARESLESAASVFDEIGASGWSEQARAELSRVAGRRPGTQGVLTPTEARVTELAAAGLANKEIASSLFVSVYTVERHLTHAYAKLGIRSRSQLAGRLRPDDA